MFEKTCVTTQKKRKNSCFLDLEKNRKQRKNRTYIFTSYFGDTLLAV